MAKNSRSTAIVHTQVDFSTALAANHRPMIRVSAAPVATRVLSPEVFSWFRTLKVTTFHERVAILKRGAMFVNHSVKTALRLHRKLATRNAWTLTISVSPLLAHQVATDLATRTLGAVVHGEKKCINDARGQIAGALVRSHAMQVGQPLSI